MVRIFLGDVTQGENGSFNFGDTPTQIGSVYNFSAPSSATGSGPSGCGNCQKQEQEHALCTGQVIITDPLVEHIQREITSGGMQLRSLDREEVVEYLKTNLHWRITMVGLHVSPSQ